MQPPSDYKTYYAKRPVQGDQVEVYAPKLLTARAAACSKFDQMQWADVQQGVPWDGIPVGAYFNAVSFEYEEVSAGG